MGIMTCTELSLAPARGYNANSLEFPNNLQFSANEIRNFSDPQYFTAQTKLCCIKYRAIQTISNLRLGNTLDRNTLINPCFQALHQWRMEFQPCLDFTENGRFRTQHWPIHLRELLHHCFCDTTKYEIIWYFCSTERLTTTFYLVFYSPSPSCTIETTLFIRPRWKSILFQQWTIKSQ